MFKEIDFAGFDGREEKLQKIIRYNMERRTPMHYRTNDLIHSKRVHLLVNDILPTIAPIYNNGLNPSKALTLALVHDDAEILTGDVQLYYKDRMSLEQLTELKLKEKQAIEDMKLIKFIEKDYDGTIADGTPKHWHSFHVLAGKN